MSWKNIFILAGKRTPFGSFGGTFKNLSATDLQVFAGQSALQASGIAPETIESVCVGNVAQTGKDGAYISRHSALRMGIPIAVPAVNINRLCGSGFESIVYGCREIVSGERQAVLCGGTENMSQAPFVARDIRFGVKLGADPALEDSLWTTLTDQLSKLPMGMTAENLAEKYGISREECDKYALWSQQRWKAALDAGVFEKEMAPVTLKSRKGEQLVNVDEHPRPDSTLQQLSKLPPVFKKNGTVTAANASGICDGAAAVVLGTEEFAKQNNVKPLARIVNWHINGCDPTIMGIGPAISIKELLLKTGKTLADIDLVEVNEAFAAQYLAVEKEAGLVPEKTNVHGGAIALGHPVGASGTRIMAHLANVLAASGGDKKYAIGSACIGGGQGIAIMIERV